VVEECFESVLKKLGPLARIALLDPRLQIEVGLWKIMNVMRLWKTLGLQLEHSQFIARSGSRNLSMYDLRPEFSFSSFSLTLSVCPRKR
jgi:hypothetical protein